jgi:hypothetical protein
VSLLLWIGDQLGEIWCGSFPLHQGRLEGGRWQVVAILRGQRLHPLRLQVCWPRGALARVVARFSLIAL